MCAEQFHGIYTSTFRTLLPHLISNGLTPFGIYGIWEFDVFGTSVRWDVSWTKCLLWGMIGIEAVQRWRDLPLISSGVADLPAEMATARLRRFTRVAEKWFWLIHRANIDEMNGYYQLNLATFFLESCYSRRSIHSGTDELPMNSESERSENWKKGKLQIY